MSAERANPNDDTVNGTDDDVDDDVDDDTVNGVADDGRGADAFRLPGERELTAAAERLRGQVRRTPVLEIGGAQLGVRARVLVKLELLQHTGSFKARGALNTLLVRPHADDGVVAASGGNHGAAVAWAAARVGAPARIFVPATSPPVKAERVRSYGAEVVVVDGYYPEAFAAAERWSAGRSVVRVHAYDAPEVAAGQGTLGLEAAEQVPDVSTVLVSCGGGGLYAGTALALAGRAVVVPVEPERCPSLSAAVAAGGPVPVEVGGVAADSMGAGMVGRHGYAVAARTHTSPLLVSDEAIAAARAFLWERCRVLAEPGGATALAALTSGVFTPAAGQTVVVVVSGGNTTDVPT
ncbi:serine/threonine dehydratase [Actinopolymorpha cephalotaxi]|nr:serine/threonine dehydratase [Actinopolymorpha cephalotaxi]